MALSHGTFDDGWTSGQLFWGVAASRRSPRFERGELGGYYLGLDRAQSVYVQGIAAERRHTVGMKWTGSGARVTLNYDVLLQWGTFGGAPVRAWAFATETGFQLSTRGWRPRLGVRADLASGDRDAADPRLEAFNPLFPGNSYSGAVGLLGTNPGVLVDWQVTRHCQLQAAITRFLPGAFVKNTFVSPGFGFYSASAIYRF